MRILVLFLLISVYLPAQDTVRMINNEFKLAKIIEVGIENVKYKQFNNLDGPIYITPKNEIRYIRYSTGLLEEYSKKAISSDSRPIDVYEARQAEEAIAKKNAPPPPPPARDTTFYKLDFVANKLVYKNRPISEKRLRDLVYEYPNVNTKNTLTNFTEDLRKYKKRQIAFMAGGLGGTLAFLYAGFYISYFNWIVGSDTPDAVWPTVLVGAVTFGIGGPAISSVYKKKRKSTKQKIVKLYNEGR